MKWTDIDWDRTHEQKKKKRKRSLCKATKSKPDWCVRQSEWRLFQFSFSWFVFPRQNHKRKFVFFSHRQSSAPHDAHTFFPRFLFVIIAPAQLLTKRYHCSVLFSYYLKCITFFYVRLNNKTLFYSIFLFAGFDRIKANVTNKVTLTKLIMFSFILWILF